MDLDFEECFLAVESHVNEIIFVDQNPLQGGGKLLVIVHDEDGLEGFRMNGFVEGPRVLWFFSHENKRRSYSNASRVSGALVAVKNSISGRSAIITGPLFMKY